MQGLAGHSNREGIKRRSSPCKLHKRSCYRSLRLDGFYCRVARQTQNDRRAKQGTLPTTGSRCRFGCRFSLHVLLCVQVGGNVKAAVGSVKETVGAAVGARQMEADGTHSVCFPSDRPLIFAKVLHPQLYLGCV